MHAKALVPDKHPAGRDMIQLYMSLVGAMAWLIMTNASHLHLRGLPPATDSVADSWTRSTCKPLTSVGREEERKVGLESGSVGLSHRYESCPCQTQRSRPNITKVL